MKHKGRSANAAPFSIAIGFCRSDDRTAMANQEETIRAYAGLHRMVVHAVVVQEGGARLSAEAMSQIIAKRPDGEDRCVLLITDLGRLTRRGYDDHQRLCDQLAREGIDIRATGTSFLLRSRSLPR